LITGNNSGFFLAIIKKFKLNVKVNIINKCFI
jgi:hypothetical protein